MKKLLLILIFFTFQNFYCQKDNNLNKQNEKLSEIVKKQLILCDQLKDPKKAQECKEKLLLLAMNQKLNDKEKTKPQKPAQQKPAASKPLPNKPKPSQSNPNNPKPKQTSQIQPNMQNQLPIEEKNETAQILSNVANVVTSFGQLVIDPKNPQNVTQSLTNMIGGMINLISNMTRNKRLSDSEIDQIILNMDQDLKEELVKVCIDEAMNVKKNN